MRSCIQIIIVLSDAISSDNFLVFHFSTHNEKFLDKPLENAEASLRRKKGHHSKKSKPSHSKKKDKKKKKTISTLLLKISQISEELEQLKVNVAEKEKSLVE